MSMNEYKFRTALHRPEPRIVLDEAGPDIYIENTASGVRIALKIENGVYMVEMSVVPFQGQVR